MTVEAHAAIFGSQEPVVAPQVEPPVTPATTQPAPQDTHDVLRELQNKGEAPTQTDPPKNEKEELYQTKYQDLLAKAKKSGLYTQLVGKEAKTEPKKDPVANAANEMGEISLTPDGLAKMLRETVENTVGGLLQKQRQEDFYALESQTADEAIAELERQGVGKDDLVAAYTDAIRDFSIDIKRPGGPSAAITALVKELELRDLRKRAGNRAQTASDETRAKVEMAKGFAQPSPSSPPAPREVSYKEKVFEMMKNAGNPQAKTKIFKGEPATS